MLKLTPPDAAAVNIRTGMETSPKEIVPEPSACGGICLHRSMPLAMLQARAGNPTTGGGPAAHHASPGGPTGDERGTTPTRRVPAEAGSRADARALRRWPRDRRRPLRRPAALGPAPPLRLPAR